MDYVNHPRAFSSLSYTKILLLTSFFASSLACAKMILNPWYTCDVIIFQNKKKYPSFWIFSFIRYKPLITWRFDFFLWKFVFFSVIRSVILSDPWSGPWSDTRTNPAFVDAGNWKPFWASFSYLYAVVFTRYIIRVFTSRAVHFGWETVFRRGKSWF